MKTRLLSLLMGATLLSACAHQEGPPQDGDARVRSMEQAQALSRESGQPILLDFWRDG